MLLDFHSAQPAPAIVAPAPESKSSRDEFPKCRASGGGGPVVYTCPKTKTQLRAYWIDLARPAVDPELGPVVETMTIDAEIHAGYIPGQGGEVARLQSLVAATMPGWEITGLSLADAPEEEF
jgi:hypothetical protein